jgi:hypothetical protein
VSSMTARDTGWDERHVLVMHHALALLSAVASTQEEGDCCTERDGRGADGDTCYCARGEAVVAAGFWR